MTEQEIKTQQALVFMGYKELKEISKSDLDLSFKALSYKMNPTTASNPKYQDGNDYLKLLEYYNYLSDIKRTNETIRNILNPNEKTYLYQDEKPEEKKEELNNDNINEASYGDHDLFKDNLIILEEVKIVDKPRFFLILLSFIMPLFGIVMFILNRSIMPKASKFYLIFGILGYIFNVVSIFIIMQL